MKKLLIPLLVLAALVGNFAAGDEGAKDKPRSPFRTAQVERGTIVQTVRATGSLEPEETVDIGAQVNGQIVKFGPDPANPNKTIDYRSTVEVGTLLVQLDDALYRVHVDLAQARVAGAQATVALEEAQLQAAERERERLRKQLAGHTVSQEDVENAVTHAEMAQARVAVARAAVKEAQAGLEEAKLQLSYTQIRSPVKGVIIDRRVMLGQTVTGSLNAPTLFLVATDLKRLQVWAQVRETDIAGIREGQAATFTVNAYPNLTFRGVVSQVRLNARTGEAPEGNASSKTQNAVTYTVVVAADNTDGKLLPYLTADVRFKVAEHKDALLVPRTALRWWPLPEQVVAEEREAYRKSLPPAGFGRGRPDREGSEHSLVWVPDGNLVRPVQVRLGLTDALQVEITEGEVHAGDAVVVGEAPADDSVSTENPSVPRRLSPPKPK